MARAGNISYLVEFYDSTSDKPQWQYAAEPRNFKYLVAMLNGYAERMPNVRFRVIETFTSVQELRLPREWERDSTIQIADPDGWRGKNGRPFDEPITKDEFLERLQRCTLKFKGQTTIDDFLDT